MEVSKDSKQTRRPLAGLSELLPRHAHRTRTGTHHTKPSPGWEKGGICSASPSSPYALPSSPAAHIGGEKSRQETNSPTSERLAFSRVKFWPLNDFPAWPG